MKEMHIQLQVICRNSRAIQVRLLIGVLLVCILMSCESEEPEIRPPADGIPPLHAVDVFQTAKRRKWRDVELRKVELHRDASSELYGPISVQIFDGFVYVVDYSRQQLVRFSLDGEMISTYGEGPGKGPGEFQYMLPVGVHDNTIWIPDSFGRRLSRFDRDSGAFLGGFNLYHQPFRAWALDTESVISVQISGERLFQVFDQDGRSLGGFGELIEDQIGRGFAVAGDLTRHPHGGFLYAPHRASFVYHLDTDFEVKTLFSTIGRAPFPRAIPVRGGSQYSATTLEMHVRRSGISVDGDEFILASDVTGPDDSEQAALDYYNMKSGKYKHSIRVPFRLRHGAAVGDGIMYCIRDTMLQAYSLK